jgi:hypothetical protein
MKNKNVLLISEIKKNVILLNYILDKDRRMTFFITKYSSNFEGR